MGYVKEKVIGSRKYYYYVHSSRRKKIEKYLGLVKPTKKDIEEIEKENFSIKLFLEEKEVDIKDIKLRYQKWLKEATTDAKFNYQKYFISHFTFNTNKIEGSSLSYKDTKIFLEEGLTPRDKPIRDIKEAENHKNAYMYIIENSLDLNESLILTLHQLLKKGVSEDAGSFRDRQVFVSNIVPIKANLIEDTLSNIMSIYNHSQLHILEKVAQFHADFERIHPFFDGNGRIGRLIINYMLLSEGYPPLILQNKNKRRYYNALQRSDDGNLLFLVKYIYSELNFWSKNF